MMNETYHRLRNFYTQGGLPWDQTLPPPEIIQEIDLLPPGRALDLGCGYGRAAIYMAQHGWSVDAVDFVPQAITVARLRAAAAGVKIQFHLATVTDLKFLDGPFDFAMDVGCAHSLDYAELATYQAGLARLLRPGARYMLYARLREEEAPAGPPGPKGLPVSWIKAVFLPAFDLEKEVYGLTETPNSIYESGWFWFRKQA